MKRLPGITLGLLVGGAAGCSVAVIFQSRDLQGSDGLAPGFAWLILFVLTFFGIAAGGVTGWFQAPRLNRFLAGLKLKEQLQPPGDKKDR